jgi:hypothetical protein
VAWHGSDRAAPKAPGDETPVLYSRQIAGRDAFEAERNVVRRHVTGLDAGTVAADASGNVYVGWHAFEPGLRGEEDRRVWIARSRDDGASFAEETAASPATNGTCGCCGIGLATDRGGALYALYRSVSDTVHRDTYLLSSRDRGQTFANTKVQNWDIGACPMSTFTLARASSGMLAAWETDGQVQWSPVESLIAGRGAAVAPAGTSKDRKHPVLAVNRLGEILLVWTEATGWNRGGNLAWQLYDPSGNPVGDPGRAAGVPVWSLAAVAARPDGSFAILY